MDVRKTLRALARRFFGATSGAARPLQWLVDWVRGDGGTDSGIAMDGERAMRYAPVWYGVNKIAGHIAQMPLVLNEDLDDGRRRRRAKEHPAYPLVKRRPNALMSASVFKEVIQYHALMWGNGRAAIERNYRMDPVSLIPLLPDRTKTVLVNGEKWHVTRVTYEDGTSEDRKFRDRDVLHIAGLGFDGLTGYSLWEFAANSFGLGLGSEKAANRHFKHDAMPGLLLEAPAGMFRDESDAAAFLAAFRKAHEGLDNKSKVGLLREGIKANAIGASAGDSQWIEQRRFQRQDAALWLMLETILGDDASVSYNGLEQKMLAYLVNCLNRWLVKWEEECGEKLLREREKRLDTHYFKFVTGALLRSDTATTMSTGALAITSRILNPNEVRAWFELDPYEGGDEYINPNTTANAGRSGGKQDDEDGDPPDDPPDDNPSAQARSLIVNRLKELIAVEAKRVRAAAKKSANFVAWVDEFYGETRFLATLSRIVGSMGGETWHAIEHANASKQQILEAAGRSTPAELAANIEHATADWPARAEALADEILSLETAP